MNKRLSQRLNKVEKKLKPGKESNVVPQVIIVSQDEPHSKEKGVVTIGGYAEKQGE